MPCRRMTTAAVPIAAPDQSPTRRIMVRIDYAYFGARHDQVLRWCCDHVLAEVLNVRIVLLPLHCGIREST